MRSRKPNLQELEQKRATLNQQLMNAQNQAEANRIERELWALRTAISYHKSRMRESGLAPSAEVTRSKLAPTS